MFSYSVVSYLHAMLHLFYDALFFHKSILTTIFFYFSIFVGFSFGFCVFFCFYCRKTFATVFASLFGVATLTRYFAKSQIIVTAYKFPFSDIGNGPIVSMITVSKIDCGVGVITAQILQFLYSCFSRRILIFAHIIFFRTEDWIIMEISHNLLSLFLIIYYFCSRYDDYLQQFQIFFPAFLKSFMLTFCIIMSFIGH